VGDRQPRLMPQRSLAEILEPRAQELVEMLRDNLRHSGALELCVAGVVLTGGGSRLSGMPELTESLLKRPARLAVPAAISKMPSTLAEAEFAAVVGMIFYGHRAYLARGPQPQGFGARLRSLFSRNGVNGHGGF